MGLSRIALTWTIASGVTLAGLGLTTVMKVNELSDLQKQSTALASDVSRLSKATKDRVAEQEGERIVSTKEATGLDPEQVLTDTDIATEYFLDAFNWSSGDEYDRARSNYEKSLGKGNSFTKTYLSDNTKIDTDKGKLSYIDFKKLRASMDDMYIVPTKSDGKNIRYVGFVRYFMKSGGDINSKKGLNASEAILEFTVGGPAKDRRVKEVEARQGFASSLGDE